MKKEWSYLFKLFGKKEITIKKVAIESEAIELEGSFDLPPLAKLSPEDQVFAAVFIKSHGSIKEMERYFGVSYPTIKARLNSLANQLDFVKVEQIKSEAPQVNPLELLEKGKISVDEAIRQLEESVNSVNETIKKFEEGGQNE